MVPVGQWGPEPLVNQEEGATSRAAKSPWNRSLGSFLAVSLPPKGVVAGHSLQDGQVHFQMLLPLVQTLRAVYSHCISETEDRVQEVGG